MLEKVMTEDQYHLFCKIVDEYLKKGHTSTSALEKIEADVRYCDEPNSLLESRDELKELFEPDPTPHWNELLALANPASRDLVKEHFVEATPRHFWVKELPLSAQIPANLRLAIVADDSRIDGRIIPTSTLSTSLTTVYIDSLAEVADNYFTKAELIAAGFDPDAWVAYGEQH